MSSSLALTGIVCFFSLRHRTQADDVLAIRRKARAIQLDTANEKDMAAIMKAGAYDQRIAIEAAEGERRVPVRAQTTGVLVRW